MRLTFLPLLALPLLGCPNAASPNPLPVPDSDQCAPMCAHLQALNCAEGQPLYDSDLPGDAGVPNETCTQDCVKQPGNGVFYNPKCVETVPTCAQIEAYRKMTCN